MLGAIQNAAVDAFEAVARAMGRTPVAGRPFFSKYPRAALTGHPVQGFQRAITNFSPKAIGVTAAFGVAATMVNTSQAPRGHFFSSMATTTGTTVGGFSGSVIGGFLGGLPGEIIGGLVGGELGERIGHSMRVFTQFGRNQRRLNFGSFEDDQPAYTMRQVASQEMSRSLLNARTYLGKESLLMHQ